MPVFTDQIENYITLSDVPQRIISVVPSQTELLFHLELDEEVIGITKFCIHPRSWFQHKTRVGGTKQLNRDLIRALQPDLIIANKEENSKEQVEELRKVCPVWTSDVIDIPSALAMIGSIGALVGRTPTASAIASAIANGLAAVPPPVNELRVAYLIWQQPYMVAGGDTFIHAMLEAAGFVNSMKDRARYPSVTMEEIIAAGTDIVFLSSEPFPFTEKHQEHLQSTYSDLRFELVDGEMFSWYGSRLLQMPAYINSLREQLK